MASRRSQIDRGHPMPLTNIPASAHGECERVVADLLSYMTPLEKAGQLAIRPLPDAQDRSANESFHRALREGRVGAVSAVGHKSAADGLQQIAIEQSRLGIPLLFPVETGSGIETIFPSPLAAAASWDEQAIARAEAVVATEAAAEGFNWALSPEVRMATDPARTSHINSSEQVVLAKRLTAARVLGLQHADADHRATMMATLEMPAAEQPRSRRTAEFEASAMLQTALYAIRESALGAIAFDSTGTTDRGATERAFAFLKGPGGFDGIMLSEWEALAGMALQTETGASVHDMPVDALAHAVTQGRIPQARLDDAVARVLRMKYRLGLFSEAMTDHSLRAHSSVPTPMHNRQVAHELARKSVVLLRNEPAVLPLSLDAGDVLIVGGAAIDRQLPLAGRKGVAASLIDGMERLGVPHKYVPGLALRGDGAAADRLIDADSMAIGMAREAARRAGTVVVVLDHDNYLTEAANMLLQGLRAINPRLVLVTLGARPLDPEIGGAPLPGVVHAGRLGTMSGHAIADILTGEAVPSGKLPITAVTETGARKLPFGHGLSYGDFALGNVALNLGDDRITATGDLRNFGQFSGTETVQLYVQKYHEGSLPSRLILRSFHRIHLAPDEQSSFTFDIGRDEIGEYREDGRFVIEEGLYDVRIGLSSGRTRGGEIMLPAAVAQAMLSRPQPRRLWLDNAPRRMA